MARELRVVSCYWSKNFLPMLILLGLVLALVMVLAQDDQSGFISIDCGIDNGLAYTDAVTGINYVSDAEFTQSGEIHNLSPTTPGFDKLTTNLKTLRSFPENSPNCYTLRPTQGKGNKYLIRASFMYGNYDAKNKVTSFDCFLGPDYWHTLIFNSSSGPISIEIIHVPLSDYIHVCLVDTGTGTPFVSAIELRPLASDMYKKTDLGSLQTFSRVNFGGNYELRYKTDKYDRIWKPFSINNAVPVYTVDKVGEVDSVPSEVMSSADKIDSFGLSWIPKNTTDQFLMYIHFAEIEILKSNEIREFNIYLNDELWYGPFTPPNHTTTTLVSTAPQIVVPNYTLRLNRTKRSTLPTLINALEIYILKRIPEIRQTDDKEASAMWSIKSNYRITRHWQGDPCAPQNSVWEGLRCRYNDTDSARIIFLNLSSTSGSNREIDPAIANLTMIETLDLSYNSLIGTVPDFLCDLKFLKVLNLTGNNFSGPVPEKLLAKSKEGSLIMSLNGEIKNKKDNKIITPVVVAVASIFVILIVVLTTIWMIKKKKAHAKKKTSTGLEIKKQKFTYSEIESITDNFKVVIGRGGFGEVYHGYISETEVAVKMLSQSSLQGDKEFQAEANLLLSVHHRNITSLVGFCDEGMHKGIIYEYMAHGNLQRRLFDTSSSVLNWEERLQIGCDAAHGLEYLHHGCKPPIVHRDVKCTNILLDGTCHAKLADFGLSKVFPAEGDTHITTAIVGTPGYLDPEYYTSGRLTEKSDVYSFGIVLLVIVTGRQAIIKKDDNANISISRWASLKLEDGELENIVDPRLVGDFDINSAWKVIEVAMTCVAHMPSRRPTMKEVVTELSDCLAMERARKETQPREFTERSFPNLESAYAPNPR